jgi:heme exporter protein B
MRETLRDAITIARKDLLLEFRARTTAISALVFSALVLVIFYFARDPTEISDRALAPSVLWVTFTFAGMLGLNRAFQIELETRALDGILLAPANRTSLYLGKVFANLAFVLMLEAITVPLFGVFFNVDVVSPLVPLAGVIILATIAFVAVGTLFSAMTARTRFAELMLPVLLVPFLMPPITAAVQMTERLFAGRPLSEVAGWLRLLAAYDIAFVILGILLFEATLDE